MFVLWVCYFVFPVYDSCHLFFFSNISYQHAATLQKNASVDYILGTFQLCEEQDF